MIGVSPAIGDVRELISENYRQMMSAAFIICLDKNGNFLNVKEGEIIYSISEWNNNKMSTPTNK